MKSGGPAVIVSFWRKFHSWASHRHRNAETAIHVFGLCLPPGYSTIFLFLLLTFGNTMG